MTREEIISGLKFTIDMFMFDPSTGETLTEPRNDMDKTTIESCKGAIKELQDNSYELWKESYEVEHERNIRLEEKIKALEQEPCEDCISRQAVLAIAGDSCLDLDSYEDTKDFCDEINELPPVTPKPKTGHWIKVTNGRGGHECDVCHDYAPSFQSGDEYLSTFCPNCGAKMERSDKE